MAWVGACITRSISAGLATLSKTAYAAWIRVGTRVRVAVGKTKELGIMVMVRCGLQLRLGSVRG